MDEFQRKFLHNDQFSQGRCDGGSLDLNLSGDMTCATTFLSCTQFAPHGMYKVIGTNLETRDVILINIYIIGADPMGSLRLEQTAFEVRLEL